MNWYNRFIFIALCLVAQSLAAHGVGDNVFSAKPVTQSGFALGINYREAANMGDQPYSGSTIDAPVVQFDLALGDSAEAVLGLSAMRSMFGGDEEHFGGGDPYFYTKLRLAQWQQGADSLAQLSFIWGVLEPAANRPLGDDRLTFYALLAYGFDWDNWRLDLNYGTAIAESFNPTNQIDIVQAGAALAWQMDSLWQLKGEWFYQQQTTGSWFDFTKTVSSEFDRSILRVGADYGEQQQWQVRLQHGLNRPSGDLGASLAYRWQLGK